MSKPDRAAVDANVAESGANAPPAEISRTEFDELAARVAALEAALRAAIARMTAIQTTTHVRV